MWVLNPLWVHVKFPAVSRGSALASAGLSTDVLWACSSVSLLPGLRPSLVAGLGFAGDAGCVRDQRPESQVTFPSPKEGVCGDSGGEGWSQLIFLALMRVLFASLWAGTRAAPQIRELPMWLLTTSKPALGGGWWDMLIGGWPGWGHITALLCSVMPKCPELSFSCGVRVQKMEVLEWTPRTCLVSVTRYRESHCRVSFFVVQSWPHGETFLQVCH